MARKKTFEQDRIALLKLLRDYKVHYTEPNLNHFKMRDLNYWPSSGKLFVDGAHACHPDRGLQALEAELRRRGYRRDKPSTPAPASQSPRPTMPTLSIELDNPDVNEG